MTWAGSAGGSDSLVLFDLVDVLMLGLAVLVLVAALHFARRARARRERAWPLYLLAVCVMIVAVGRLLSRHERAWVVSARWTSCRSPTRP